MKIIEVTDKELRKLNASAYEDGTTVYVYNSKTDMLSYMINLKKRGYKSFMCTTVEDCAFNILGCTPGTPGGWPYYIADFIHR